MFRIKHCREIVLKILYQTDLTEIGAAEWNEAIEDYFRTFRRVNMDEEAFIVKMVETVFANLKSFDEKIGGHLIGWKLKRLNPIDRVLLRMGMAEATFNDQKAIIIDDIIRMAKKYGDQDSYKFINAILDKVIS